MTSLKEIFQLFIKDNILIITTSAMLSGGMTYHYVVVNALEKDKDKLEEVVHKLSIENTNLEKDSALQNANIVSLEKSISIQNDTLNEISLRLEHKTLEYEKWKKDSAKKYSKQTQAVFNSPDRNDCDSVFKVLDEIIKDNHVENIK